MFNSAALFGYFATQTDWEFFD